MSGNVAPIRLRQDRSILLSDAIEALAGASRIDDVIDILRRMARRLTGADGIAVILRDKDRCSYVEEDAISPLWKGQNFPMVSCISGWAMLNKQTVVIGDIDTDERIPQDLYRSTFVRSLMMVPVRAEDPIGAIGAYWARPHLADDEEIEALERLARVMATSIDNVRLVSELSDALEDAELARDELRHRVKNAYAATQALAVLTLPAEHSEVLNSRIDALARAHHLLDRKLDQRDTISIGELVAAELEPYATDNPLRIRAQGPSVDLSSAQAVAFGLAINELATNALKHGALSTFKGCVEVTWSRDGNNLHVIWTESGGPEVVMSGTENMGSRLLSRLVERQLKGSLDRRLPSSWATCRIHFPMD